MYRVSDLENNNVFMPISNTAAFENKTFLQKRKHYNYKGNRLHDIVIYKDLGRQLQLHSKKVIAKYLCRR